MYWRSIDVFLGVWRRYERISIQSFFQDKDPTWVDQIKRIAESAQLNRREKLIDVIKNSE